MKKTYRLLIALLFFIFTHFQSQAQNTTGTDFWLTFGRGPNGIINLQIRIVAGEQPTTGTIYFTQLGDSIEFSIAAREVYTHKLTENQIQAVYNQVTSVSNKSIYIHTEHPVSVYALNQRFGAADATNVLPATALGTDYYLLSYFTSIDAYAVVAIEDNTNVYHNGNIIPAETLNKGDVYYYVIYNVDLTGTHITTNNKPIALFAVCPVTSIPSYVGYGDNLFQQISPVNTWGKNFFVPVSHLTKDIVRIVASKDNTTILQEGGTMLYPPAWQTSYTIHAGQFIELELSLANKGCYIQADKPVGVCTYLTSDSYHGMGESDPAQTWIPAIEQKSNNLLIAPFMPLLGTNLNDHRALVVTPTATKNDTKVSISGGTPTAISGTWYDSDFVGISFYNLPLTNTTASYYFTNNAGLIVMCYGVGHNESYYYLAGSAMRELDAAFYANDIHFQDLKDTTFCAGNVSFRAEIENMGVEMDSIKWFINQVKEILPYNQLEWNKTIFPGNYEIRMWVRFENNDTISKTGMMKIQSCNNNAAFYVNNVHYQDLQNITICTKDVVNFRAEIEGISSNPGSLKWYIDGEEDVSARDSLEWSKSLTTGEYEIKMEVFYENNETAEREAILKVEVFWVKMRNVRY